MKADDDNAEILCGNASDSLYLTFKGGCRKPLTYQECYRCTGCGGRFHKDCILEHFKLEESHDWGRQQEREKLEAERANAAVEARVNMAQWLNVWLLEHDQAPVDSSRISIKASDVMMLQADMIGELQATKKHNDAALHSQQEGEE